MENDTRQARTEAAAAVAAWGEPAQGRESFLDGPAMWLTGGATLLLWTALALLLTSA